MTCLKVPYTILVTAPLVNTKTNVMISEGYRRNFLSRGGREVFDNATLPGHLNGLHLKTTGRVLQFVDQYKSEDQLTNYRLKMTFGEQKAMEREDAANNGVPPT